MINEVWIFACRQFVQWLRYPMVPLQSLLFPTILLVTYSLLVGKSMVRVTGDSGLDLLIPVCAMAGAMSGSVSAGLMLTDDRERGLITRFWVLPVHRGSALGGILLAEALRTVVGTVVLTTIGWTMGFRFHGNLIALFMYMVLPCVIVVVYTAIVLAIGLSARGRIILTWFGTVSMGMAFAAIVPADKTPTVLRPLAEHQPVASAVHAMRGLSVSAFDHWTPLVVTALWVTVLGALFGKVAVRNYRLAAESGTVGA